MKSTEKQIKSNNKPIYEAPVAQIIVFESEDVITTSGGNNFGEWDPQNFRLEE